MFSSDGARVLTASVDSTARIWDAATGQSRAELKGHSGPVTSAVFSSDGARVLTASEDKTARTWDAATGQSLAELKGHSGPVTSAVFSSDGARVLTASDDNTARIWQVLGSEPRSPPSWFLNLLRIAAARSFGEDGDVIQLTGPDWTRMKAQVRAAALQDKTRYGEIERWYFGNAAP